VKHNLYRSREVEALEPSTMTTEHHVCKQHIITNPTQQDDGGFVFRLPTKMDLKHLYLLASLQSEVYIFFNIDWNKNSNFNTTIS